MYFIKIRQVMGEVVQGDYYGYDTESLNTALKALSPDIQLLGTDESTQLSFTVFCPQEQESAVRAVVLAHGSKEQVLARTKVKKKSEVNAAVVTKIRCTYDADAEYKILRTGVKNGKTNPDFDTYDKFVEGKRSQGTTLKAIIDACTTVEEVDAISIIIT